MRVATVWQAMDQHPVGFLGSPWPWRALLYLVSGVAVGAPTVVVAIAVTATTSPMVAVVVDVVVVLAVVAAVGPLARLERRRVRLVDDHPVPDPPRVPITPGLLARWRARRREPATWRELGFVLLTATALCALDLVVLGFALALPVVCFVTAAVDPTTRAWAPVGLLVLAGAPYTVSAWAGARAVLVRTVLGPRDRELGVDLVEVDPPRRRLLDAFAAERTRIERDLHDGAQQRLVSVTLSLGLARLSVPDDDPGAEHLAAAQEQLGVALAELRDLVRGIDPLAGRGLAAALAEHAAVGPVPITVDVDLPRRVPPDVASAAYFVVTEAMTNLARHSGATAARVTGRHHADTLVVEVTDDGIGGADPGAGSGLAGLAERVALVDGRLRLSSPPGGPTLVRVEVPCRFE